MERTKIVTGTLEDRRAIDRIFKEMTSGDYYAEVLKQTGWRVASIDDQSTMTDYQTKAINQIEIGINLQSRGFAEAKVMIHKGLLWINTGHHMRGTDKLIQLLKDMIPACSDQDQIALVREWLGEVKLHHLVELKDLHSVFVNGCEPLPNDWDGLAEAILSTFVGPSEPLNDMLANEIQDRFMTFVQMKCGMEPAEEEQIDVAKNTAWMSHIPAFEEFQNDIMKIFAEHLRIEEMHDKIVRYADRPIFITVKED